MLTLKIGIWNYYLMWDCSGLASYEWKEGMEKCMDNILKMKHMWTF